MHEITLVFIDHPIEFKEINPEDFPDLITSNKVTLEPNEEGYINESIQENINLEEKNTIVINAAVGQGKSFSITHTAKRFYDSDPNYVILIAAPFKSLVNQYYNKVSDILEDDTDILKIDQVDDSNEDNLDSSFFNKRIHVVTTNALLGNPGDQHIINSHKRREYLRELIANCEQNNKKVIIIYDEIHDAIHNFKEEYIFNLWRWKDVLHKNIILSATFNEASKVVIEYLSELTENKLHILESPRQPILTKQSSLILNFNRRTKYNNTDSQICELVDSLIKKGKEIDILCFSKALADDICSNAKRNGKGIGYLLFEKYGDQIQNCTTQKNTQSNFSQKKKKLKDNRYNPNKCNVGTNFSTGVSIEKNNHAFIIILPPYTVPNPSNGAYGIFSGGSNSILQALARQRTKGEIHVILPQPNELNYNQLPFGGFQKEKFIEIFEPIKKSNSDNQIVYKSIKDQSKILYYYYHKIYKVDFNSTIEKVNASNRISNGLDLNFPSLKSFILNKGEKHLINKYPLFGGSPSIFMTYGALTNQFFNCRLTNIYFEKVSTYKLNSIKDVISSHVAYYFTEDFLEENYSIPEFYEFILHSLVGYGEIYYFPNGNDERVSLKKSSNDLKKGILCFLHKNLVKSNKQIIEERLSEIQSKKNANWLIDGIKQGKIFSSGFSPSITKKQFDISEEEEIFFNSNEKESYTSMELKDWEYTLEYHLLIHMKYALIVRNNQNVTLTDEEKLLVEFYYELYMVRKEIIRSIQKKDGIYYLKKYTQNPLFEPYKDNIVSLINNLKNLDPILKSETLRFISSSKEISPEKKSKQLYDKLLLTIAEIKIDGYQPTKENGTRPKYIKILSSIFPLDDVVFNNKLI